MFSFLVGKYPGIEWLDCASAAHLPLYGVVKPSSVTVPPEFCVLWFRLSWRLLGIILVGVNQCLIRV